MTANEEKAIEIYCEGCLNKGWDKCKNTCTNYTIAVLKLYEMAQWKDEQFEKLLPELMICAQQGYTQCASDEVTINEMKRIMKGTKK